MGRWIYIGAVDLHRGGGFTQGRWGGGMVDLHRGGRAVGGGGGGRWIYKVPMDVDQINLYSHITRQKHKLTIYPNSVYPRYGMCGP